ncbi:hypothetical protein HS125_17805 [bacterium]|nr:hypothetical protein [bacterium]
MRIAGIALGALMMLFPTFVQAQDDLTPSSPGNSRGTWTTATATIRPGRGHPLRSGHVGRAAIFNGRTSVANYGSQSRWTFSRRDDFTLDFWLKTSQTPETIATVIMAQSGRESQLEFRSGRPQLARAHSRPSSSNRGPGTASASTQLPSTTAAGITCRRT